MAEPIDPTVNPDSDPSLQEQIDAVNAAQEFPVPNNTTVPNTPGLDQQVPNTIYNDDGSYAVTANNGVTTYYNADGSVDYTSAANPIVGKNDTIVTDSDASGYGLKVNSSGTFGGLNPANTGGIGLNPGVSPGVSPGTYPSTQVADGPSLIGGIGNAQSQGGAQNVSNYPNAADWRVRIALADNANYLYKIQPKGTAGILEPLRATNGVIFPYTPQINVSYNATYDQQELTHSNYKMFFYKNSSVGDISISCDFTAQDTGEADYVLAVMHFFRTVTKMFYGQDQNPPNGVPPPLVFLSGYGAYQFDKHPMLVTNFTMNLPDDVDYIRTSNSSIFGSTGFNLQAYNPSLNTYTSPIQRLFGSGLRPGATAPAPNFKAGVNSIAGNGVTYVPTKMKITINCIPVVSRNAVSQTFSVQNYASGTLLQGSILKTGGGFW